MAVINITGASLSGNSGEQNRTYTLPFDNVVSESIKIYVDGQFLHPDSDYSLATNVLTFLGLVFNQQKVYIYYVATGDDSETPSYCDSLDVLRYLQWPITQFTSSTDPTLDEVNDFILDAEDEIDMLTNSSWRATTVTNEFIDFPQHQIYNWGTGYLLPLDKRQIRSITKLEIWGGGSYEDWVSTKTEGRGNDYWFDGNLGQLFIRYYPLAIYRKKKVRVTYIYGGETVPNDIRKATAMLAAIELLSTDDKTAQTTETGDPTRLNYSSRIERMQKRIDKIIRNRFEFTVF